MEEKHKIRQLLTDSLEGNFKSVKSLLKAVLLNDSTAVQVIVECGRIFYKNVSQPQLNSENLEDLFEVLLTCSKFIENIDEASLLSVLQALFFFVKFFVTSENLECLIRLRKVLEQVGGSNNSQIVSTYSAICKQLHNALLQLDAANVNGTVYQELLEMILVMNVTNHPAVRKLTRANCSYFRSKNFQHSEAGFQFRCYCLMLRLIVKPNRACNADPAKDVYTAIIKVLKVFVTNLLMTGKTDTIPLYLKETTKLKELKQSPPHYKMLQIVRLVFKLITSDPDTHDLQMCLVYYLKDFEALYEIGLRVELRDTFMVIETVINYWIERCPQFKASRSIFDVNNCGDFTLYDFLAGIGGIVARLETKCSECSSCRVDTDFYTAINIATSMTSLLKDSIVRHNVSETILLRVLRYLQQCCEYIYSLKSLNCLGWRTYWSDLGSRIYNIGVKLYSSKHTNAYNYFIVFLKTLTKLEDINATTPSEIFNFEIINSALNCLSEITLYQTKQYTSALVFAALKVLLCPTVNNRYKQWMRVKNTLKEDNSESFSAIQELTVTCMLQQNQELVRDFCGDLSLNFDNDFIVKELQFELEQYKRYWPSRKAMLHTIIKLHKLAGVTTTLKSLITVWGTQILVADDDILELVQEVASQLDNQPNNHKAEQLIYSSWLHLMQYLLETRKARTKITNDINNTLILEERPTSQDESHFENESLDVVSSYSILQLDHHSKVTALLNSSLELLRKFVQKLRPENLILITEHNLQDLTAKIIEEFRLQCDGFQSLTACFLRLRLSQLLNDKPFILKTISMLLEESAISSATITKLVQEGDQIVEQFGDLSDHVEAVIIYYISKSGVYLRTKKISLGYMEYEKASNLCNVTSITKTNQLIKIKLLFLQVKYMQLPCSFQIEAHDANYLGHLSNLNYNVSMLFQLQGIESAAITSTMFDVNHSLITTYCWMKLPREVRCYCKSTITLTQKLVIPMRTAYLLTLLSQADLQSCRFNDCQVKLRGLACILNLQHNKLSDKDDREVIDDVLIQEFKNMTLDYSNTLTPNVLSGSPMVITNTFKLPAFIRHPLKCTCFYCSSIEYQNLTIMYMCLNAQLHSHTNNLKAAKLHFYGGIKIYHRVIKNTRLPKIQFMDNYDGLIHREDLLLESYSTLMLYFGNFFLKIGSIDEAEKVNSKLLNLLSEKHCKNRFLKQEVYFQKLSIAMSLNIASKVKIKARNEPFLTTNENTEHIKTPENKLTKVVFKNLMSPRLTPPKRQLIKLKCNFANPENNCEEVSERQNKLNLIRTPPPARKKANSTSERKTKIIEQTASTKKDSKIKPPDRSYLQEMPVKAASKSQPIECEEFSFCIPQSPDSYTPNAKKVSKMSSALNSKTNLLTNKIKASSMKKDRTKKKLEPDAEISSVTPSGVEEKGAKKKLELGVESIGVTTTVNKLKKVRKALLNEMQAGDDQLNPKQDTNREASARVTRSQKKRDI